MQLYNLRARGGAGASGEGAGGAGEEEEEQEAPERGARGGRGVAGLVAESVACWTAVAAASPNQRKVLRSPGPYMGSPIEHYI